MSTRTWNITATSKSPSGALYAASTVLLMIQVGVSACLLIARPTIVTTVVRHLGYPHYFPVLLGAAKLLAVVALAQPWYRELKTWAYAGITFDLCAASLSHLCVHDSAQDVLGPVGIMVLVAISYFASVRSSRPKL